MSLLNSKFKGKIRDATVQKHFPAVFQRSHSRSATSVLPGQSNDSSIVKRFYHQYVNKFVTQQPIVSQIYGQAC